jgi:hypothetical protein
MIELYVFATLAAVGYMINKAAPAQQQVTNQQRRTVSMGELPSSKNMYESTFTQQVQKKEQRAAETMYQASQDPVKSRVVPRVKSLTGEYMDPDKFTHNNMTPFFGPSMKQNLTDDANNTIMEKYTGSAAAITDIYKTKCEAGSFFDVQKNVGNVFGAQAAPDELRERYVPSRVRNNEFPVEQVRVAPGLGLGYGSEGTGGFQQYDIQDIIRPKTVDELRTANNPKTVNEGRIVNGLKTQLPAEKTAIGAFDKNRPETFAEQSKDNWFVTTGAYTRQTAIPEYDVKDTNRQDTTRPYVGVATQVDGKARQAIADPADAPKREQHSGFGIRNPVMVNSSVGLKDDYGKSTIMVYNNERQVTGARVYKGNVTSLVKSMVAPLIDAVKITKKEGAINNPRQFGNAAPQIPSKLTVYDPNGVARTTIKETLLHDDTGRGNLRGPSQAAPVYDAAEIAARATIRETLKRMAYEMNIKGGALKGQAYDPDDKARTTHKETLIDHERDGNLDALEGGGAYETTVYEAKNTLKQFTSLYDHIGNAGADRGEGYLTNPHEAKNTQKQYTSDYEYYGGAVSGDKKSMSTEAMANARISTRQEELLHGRAPTKSGAKVYTAAEDVHMQVRKQVVAPINDAPNREKIYMEPPSATDAINVTRIPKEVEHVDTRLDPAILSSLGTNPFVLNINRQTAS